jgi:hypothetical protein
MALAGLLLLGLALAPVATAAPDAATPPRGKAHLTPGLPVCMSALSTCADPYDDLKDHYVGHDEPSVEFKSSVPGSGNDITYTMTLPTEPRKLPDKNGPNGATWNFQLRPTFWFGLTLCDTESAPEFTKVCNPDSDANDLVGTDPAAADYIGKHPGNAFMELQFYGPGYVPQFEGFGCTATQYCAAMTIDSRTQDQNTGVENNAACDDFVLGGPEPINWAYVTRSGVSQGPANPLASGTLENPDFTALNPDPAQDLMMNPGDRVRIHIHDTPDGLRTDLDDLTTGTSGSMTASVANGFGHILYQPDSATCNMEPYAFHPEYSTANPRGNTWSAHTYNVAMSDEIGHFENCRKLDATNTNCVKPGDQDKSGLDEDDDNDFCVPAEDSTLVKINGCFSDDEDFDGQSYLPDWPGTLRDPRKDAKLHPSPVRFTSAATNNGTTPFETIAFEADLPAIETANAQDNPPFCSTVTGAGCVNPPNGAAFYPLYTIGTFAGTCQFQQGGPFIPGTTNTFGGSSTTEYGPLLSMVFPSVVNGAPGVITRFENFNSGDMPNPCPSTG